MKGNRNRWRPVSKVAPPAPPPQPSAEVIAASKLVVELGESLDKLEQVMEAAERTLSETSPPSVAPVSLPSPESETPKK